MLIRYTRVALLLIRTGRPGIAGAANGAWGMVETAAVAVVVTSGTSAMIVGWGGAVVRVVAATGVPLIPTHGVAGVGGAGRQKLIKGDHTLLAVEDGAVATQGRRVVVVVLRAAVRKVFVDVGFGKLGVVFCALGSVAIVGAIAIDEIALRDAIGKVVHMAFQDIVAQWIRTARFKH